MIETDLTRRLMEYDGKAITLLEEARLACREAPGYLAALGGLCTDPRGHLADGASWMLKAELEAGRPLPGEVLDGLSRDLAGLPDWQTQLHLCQSAEYLECDAVQAARFVTWAEGLAGHARPFLRAWSLHLRVVLGRRFPQYRDAADAALVQAAADPAASVRARARRLAKGG